MPRKPRVEFPGAFYHVLSRGNNRQEIFLNSSDYQDFLTCLRIIQERCPFTLYAYVLLPNHFHLLLETKEVTLSRIMLSLLTRYAKLFNQRYRRVGHLFQGRYKAILCQKDAYLLELVRYLHLNPVRAKLVNSPSEWFWSSHRAYLGIKNPDLYIEKSFVLEQFGEDLNTAQNNFANFVREGMESGQRKNYYPPESFPFLGDKTYLRQILSKKRELERRTESSPVKLRLRLEDLARVIAGYFEVSVSDLRARKKTKRIAERRAFLICIALRYSGYHNSQIARFLNLSESGITRAQQRFERRFLKDNKLREALEKITEKLKQF